MRRVRGLRDIKTHGTLAREGRLVSVARDLHRINKKGGFPEEGSWDGTINPMVLKRGTGTRRPSRDLFQELVLERNIRATQIATAQELIVEMDGFVEEELPGALDELSRLKTKLSQLELLDGV